MGLPGFLFTLGVPACTSASLPNEVRQVVVIPVESGGLDVHRPRLLIEKSRLALEAYVFRHRKADTTADSHVDIVFLDSTGARMRVEAATFYPRSILNSIRPPRPTGYLKVPVQIPSGKAAMEVRGHEGDARTKNAKVSICNFAET